MKVLGIKHIAYILILLVGGFFSNTGVTAQGKVVINEVMPYRNTSSCGLGNEFIELINLGPGPQNISCYVVATNQYTITLPNVTLQPGQLYVMSGITSIPAGCVNDIAITADLNWNNCNGCASANLTTGSGFLTDASNEKFPLLLMDPNLNILDAIHFNALQTYPSNPITVQSGQAGCATKTFNLSTYSNIKYESVTPNTGSGNSYARNVDGGCSWIKETDINGGESNTSIGESYALSATQTRSLTCDVANQTFNASNVLTVSPSTAFPITYTYGYSLDNVFTSTDTYTTLTDNDAPTIPLSNLQVGYYSVLLQPAVAEGCNEFRINFEVVNPILSVTPTYNHDCIGGSARFEITNPNTLYYPVSYALTNLGTSSTITTNANSIYQVNSLAAGDYRMTITPQPAYACPKVINFTVSTLPATSLTTTITTVPACDDGSQNGRATINITNNQPQDYYPITYILRNTSTSAIVASNSISQNPFYINNLPEGNYSLELDPALGGCLTSTFSISITSVGCDPLSQKLKSFTGKNIGTENQFNIEIDTDEVIEKIHLESSENGTSFKHIGSIPFENKKGMQMITYRSPATQQNFYRIELHDILNRIHNSSVIRITNQSGNIGIKTYPNPAGDYITLSKVSTKEDLIQATITSLSGKNLYEKQYTIKTGNNLFNIPTGNLPKGQYILSIFNRNTGDRQSSIIIK